MPTSAHAKAMPIRTFKGRRHAANADADADGENVERKRARDDEYL